MDQQQSINQINEAATKEVLKFLSTTAFNYDVSARDTEIGKLKTENRKLGIKKRNLKRIIKNKTV